MKHNGSAWGWNAWSFTITLVNNGATTAPSNPIVEFNGTALTTITKPTKTGYSFGGYYYTSTFDEGTQVIDADGYWLASVEGYTDSGKKWIHEGGTATLYAKWDHFIIYRTGDKADDPRAQVSDKESYAGGTISEIIEYRMKVRTLDQWYTLCLPFAVNAVRVYEDGTYYNLKPFYRSGGTYYTGDYIIRTPATTPGLAIANFGDWRDPTSPTDYVPAMNTPYIIQWHNSYFLNKYISFFGAAGQTIPTSMTTGAAPTSDDEVNIYGNDAMVSGSVAGAYMLEEDYGSGAWLRLDDASASRTVLPFECYIRASSTVTGKYRVIRRDMHAEDTVTGWDDVVNSETRTTITVYTLTGLLVTQYHNCSINDVAQRLNNEQHEGIYILRTDNECVKLIL
ncbi:MAG: InlB B-repeat-containing protein [Paludibacteraceae bacterium]|nr:InlB B-repeat-containing protein [Paludibacteraceae bacterium]